MSGHHLVFLQSFNTYLLSTHYVVVGIMLGFSSEQDRHSPTCGAHNLL